MKLFDDSVRQFEGTLTVKIDPPRSVRIRVDGGGTGWPGVPVAAMAPSDDAPPPVVPLPPRCASSPIDRAAGCCAKACLTAWKSRPLFGFGATDRERASWAMYCERLPGLG